MALRLLSDHTAPVRSSNGSVSTARLIEPTEAVLGGVARLLKSKDPMVLVAAIEAFRSFEDLGQRWYADIAAHTSHRDRRVRRAAADALCTFLKYSPDLDDEVVTLVQDRDANVRRLAVKRLGEIRNHFQELRDKAAAGQLMLPEQVILKRYEGHVTKLRTRIYASIAERTTQSTDADVLACSIEALGYVAKFAAKSDQETVHSLLQTLLVTSDASVCASAAYALENCPSDRKSIADNLADILRDSHKATRCRINAARAIGHLPFTTTQTVDALLIGMRSPDSDVKWAVAESIGRLESRLSKQQLAQFLGLAAHTDSRVRQGASWAIGFLSNPNDEFLNALVALLNDGDEYVSFSAAEALGKLSQRLTDQHIAGIVALATSTDRAVRKNAVEALGRLNSTATNVADALVSSLKDPEPSVRWAAVQAFGRLREKAASLIPEVSPLLDFRPDGRVVASAIEALGHVTKLDPQTLDKIVSLVGVDDSERDHRWSYAKACMSIQGLSPEAIKILCGLALDPDAQVSREATVTLSALTGHAEATCKLLAENLKPRIEKDHGFDVQATVRIVDCIGDLLPYSPDVTAANGALCSLLADPDQDVRRHAARSLARSRGCDLNCFRKLMQCIPDDTGDDVSEALIGSQPSPADELFRRDLARLRYQFPDRTTSILTLAHILGGGELDNESFIRAVLRPEASLAEPSSGQLKDEIRVIANVRRSLDGIPEDVRVPADAELISDTETKMAQHVKAGELLWGEADRAEIAKLTDCVQNKKLATEIAASLGKARKEWSWMSVAVASAVAGHLLFWIAFIVFYPKWGPAEAFFRWSPLVGNIATLGYVMLAFQWIGFLRRRLLEPYRSQLLPVDADGDHVKSSICPVSKAEARRQEAASAKTILVKDIKVESGRWVMVGDNECGKTHVLKYLAATSKEIAAYVPAAQCEHGVDQSVVSMLQGNVADGAFVATVLRNGGIPLFIDGYDEAPVGAKEQIARFAKDNKRATLVVAARSIPGDLKRIGVIALQPIAMGERLDFLRFLFDSGAISEKRVSSSEYDSACAQILVAIDSVHGDQPSNDGAKLQSPGRLVTIAKLAAAGESVTSIVESQSRR